MAGFEWAYNRFRSGNPLVEEVIAKNTESLHKGDMINLDTGEGDLAVTNDAAFMGIVIGTVDPADEVNGVIVAVNSTTKLKVITNMDAVYSVEDLNAREIGATLDIAGATGAQSLAASSNADFTVVRKSTATQRTHVVINDGEHFLN